LSPRSVQSA